MKLTLSEVYHKECGRIDVVETLYGMQEALDWASRTVYVYTEAQTNLKLKDYHTEFRGSVSALEDYIAMNMVPRG